MQHQSSVTLVVLAALALPIAGGCSDRAVPGDAGTDGPPLAIAASGPDSATRRGATTPVSMSDQAAASESRNGGSGGRPVVPTPVAAPARTGPFRADSGIVRGIYINRWASQSPRRMTNLIALADTTEINAFVIDIKDEFGINYVSQDTLIRRNGGRAGSIPNLRALLDTLQAHGILATARIVVFKDSVTARLNPGWTIRTVEDSIWRDKEGLAWVNPYHPSLWDYNIRIAEEVTRLGFDEIQWDYIRFPEPYKSLPTQVFPGAAGRSKTQVLGAFLDLARQRLSALGVRSTADVFGLVTTVPGTLEVGQSWDPLSPKADVMLPMVYPSHYPPGSFGIPRPNADPYMVVYRAISRAHERDLKMGIEGEHVRTWIQAFTLGKPPYGAREVELQKKAVYDAGYDNWVLWHPGSVYRPFHTALERRTVSRKRAWVPGMAPDAPAAPLIIAEPAAPRAASDSVGRTTRPDSLAKISRPDSSVTKSDSSRRIVSDSSRRQTPDSGSAGVADSSRRTAVDSGGRPRPDSIIRTPPPVSTVRTPPPTPKNAPARSGLD
jgi:hypothetical protein